MIQLLYFARLREALGTESESLHWPEPATVSALMQSLATRGGVWEEQFSGNTHLRAAVNQELAPESALVRPGDEVAFFPPVTGG
ncbi:molybdopterin converting factor subunit 1 [Methylobacillus flagellatus]|uniref:Molybdopterin synthase sulfur carrier subunit n=1 Tax=Methylobacillus flagellatus (strain ATCC 51484 / DSM 6875 / VKM B-1610 / KT) TaxID=265072 RepID=Q1H1V7_METFK|nr:molybdopterin converting factor subunit 1 [Methylobacillus flagellatus]ABE49530.1 molybdopterin synthase subunit MoaD [Methylobacillus flagellatus KT]